MESNKKKFFGTDGIRGRSNQFPMTADIALKLGQAVAVVLNNSQQTNRVLIGKDTRVSGYMLEAALIAGLTSMGKDVYLLGPIPTPAVSLLIKSMRADLGIMISASHNPYYDNGMKLFDSEGFKIVDEIEEKIESFLEENLDNSLVKSNAIGKTYRLKESYGRYIEYVKTIVPSGCNLKGLKIVLDCANGASYKVAPLVLYELGADVVTIGDNPNGTNINEFCGSTYIETLRTKVLQSGADIGIAFDGDADRVIMVDEKGNIIDGDSILATLAIYLKEQNKLVNNTVVGTIMANMGLEKFLKENGISLIRTKVGDRYVLEEIRKNNLNLGGEQSGHIILYDYNTTGDGLFCALESLAILVQSGKKASEVFNLFTPMPQVLKNINFEGSNPLENSILKQKIEDIKKQNENDVRILIRKSGTENLIRVMVEGENQENIESLCDSLINLIKEHMVKKVL